MAGEPAWFREGNRQRKEGGPLDPQMVLHLHRVLHVAMERAVKWRLVRSNPGDRVEPPHVPQKEAASLTVEESERLVAQLVGHEYELPLTRDGTH